MPADVASRGQIVTGLHIASVDEYGRGLATLADGTSVTVEDTLVDEVVDAYVFARQRHVAHARVQHVHTPSPVRETPQCAVYGRCGGCCWQHCSIEAQQQYKRERALAQLHDAGVTPAQVFPTICAGDGYHYRRRARLSAKWRHGSLRLGFRERVGRYVTDSDACPILTAPFATLIAPLRDCLASLTIAAAIPQIEIADRAVIIRHLRPLTITDLATLRTFAETHVVAVYLQAGSPETVVPLPATIPQPLSYRHEAFDVTIEFLPQDFVQVNAAVNEQLVVTAVDWLAPSRAETVLDAFCGIGNFTLPLARRAGHVAAVELNDDLLSRGRANAARNGIGHVRWHAADLFASQLPLLRAIDATSVLCDPPRSGATQFVTDLAGTNCQRLVYVSCDGASFASDASILTRHGFQLARFALADMFPHTAHSESIALFIRK